MGKQGARVWPPSRRSTAAGKARAGYPTAAPRRYGQSRWILRATLMGLISSTLDTTIVTQSELFVPTAISYVTTNDTRRLSEDTFLSLVCALVVRVDVAAMHHLRIGAAWFLQ